MSDVVKAPKPQHFKPGNAIGPRFAPGTSGNQGGVAKEAYEVRRLARIHCVEALETAVAIMRDPDTKPEHRLKAIDLILDRGVGKVKQAVEVTGEDGEPIKQAIRIAVSFHDPGEAVEGPVIDGAIDDGSIPEGV